MQQEEKSVDFSHNGHGSPYQSTIQVARQESWDQKQNQGEQKVEQTQNQLLIKGFHLCDSDSQKEECQSKSDETHQENAQKIGYQQSYRNNEQVESGLEIHTPLENCTDRNGLLLMNNQKADNSSDNKKVQQHKSGKQKQRLMPLKQNEQVLHKAKQLQIQKSKIRSVFFKIKLSMNIRFFVQKMLSLIYKTQYKLFQKYPQYQQILGDKASSYNQNQKLKSTEQIAQSQEMQQYLILEYQFASYCQILTSKLKFKEKMSILLDRLPIFQPFSIYRMLWDSIQLIMLSFYFILIPLQIAFSDFLYNVESSQLIAILFFIFIAFDILVNLNTSLIRQGKLIENRQQIIQHYKANGKKLHIFIFYIYQNLLLQLGLKQDIISLIPLLFLLIFHSYDFYIAQKRFLDPILLIFYWKFENCRSFLKKIEVRLHFSPRISQILKLANLLFLNLYIIHFLACIWILIADKEIQNQSWMALLQIQNSSWHVQYLCAFYFNTVTMVTVGYGDITPQTNTERLFSILTVLSACGVFAYSITEVGSIFQEMQFYKKQIKQNMYIINNYMKKKNISSELQYQVRDYLEYFWNESKFQDSEIETKIINQLSNNLKENLMIEANRAFILQSPIFQDTFSVKTILKMISLIKEQKYNPEEIIFFEDEIEDLSLYFIEKGQVEVFQAQSNFAQSFQQQSLLTLQQGAFFGKIFIQFILSKVLTYSQFFVHSQIGEKEFFTGQPRKQSFRSIEFTTLLKVDREKFLQIIKEDQDDYERYCTIRDSILNRYNIKNITRKCQFCQIVPNQRSDHLENFCPVIHYIPNFAKVQGQFRFNEIQKARLPFQRSQNLFQTKKKLYETNQNQIQFYSKNLKRLHEYLLKNCPKVDINNQSCFVEQTDSNFIYKTDNTNTNMNSNVSYSSEDSQQSYISGAESKNSKSLKSSLAFSPKLKKRKLNTNQKSNVYNQNEYLLTTVKEIKEQAYPSLPSSFSQQRNRKSSQSISSKSKKSSKSSYNVNNNSQTSSDSSQSSSSSKSSSYLENTLTDTAIVSQNEFVTMKNIERDPKVPSIQYLNLEEQNELKIQRNYINQVSDFSSNSLRQVQQRNSQVILAPPIFLSSNKNNLTFKKLSSEISQLEIQEIKRGYFNNNVNKKFLTNEELLGNINPSNKSQKQQEDQEIILEVSSERQENSIRKKSNSYSIQASDPQSYEAHLNQHLQQTLKNLEQKYASNIQTIKNNYEGFHRRASFQINKASSDNLRRQSILANQNANSAKQLLNNVTHADQYNKMSQPSSFQKSKQDISNPTLSVQNQNLLQEIKVLMDSQTGQIALNLKLIKDQFDKKMNGEDDGELLRQQEINASEFSLLEDFERMKIYEIYFSYNNYNVVIEQNNQIRRLAKHKDILSETQSGKNQYKKLSLITTDTQKRNRLRRFTSLKTSQFIIGNNLSQVQNTFSKIQNLRNEMVNKNLGQSSNKSMENTSDLFIRRKFSNRIEGQFSPSVRVFRKKSTETFSSQASPTPSSYYGANQEEKKSIEKITDQNNINLSFTETCNLQLDKIINSIKNQSDNEGTHLQQKNKSKFYSPQIKNQFSHDIDFASLQKSVLSEELSD